MKVGWLVGVGLFFSCGPKPPPALPDVVVHVDCPVKDAELWLDGRFLAEVSEVAGGIALAPGRHRLIVRHDQYHETYLAFAVAPGQSQTLPIDLARRFRPPRRSVVDSAP